MPSAPQEVIYRLIERIRRFQMRNMADIRQFHEPGAGYCVGRFFCQLWNVSEIPAKIDWRPILVYSRTILSPDNNERGNLDFRQLVADRLLVDHQSSQRCAKSPARKIATQTHPGTRFNKNFRFVRRI